MCRSVTDITLGAMHALQPTTEDISTAAAQRWLQQPDWDPIHPRHLREAHLAGWQFATFPFETSVSVPSLLGSRIYIRHRHCPTQTVGIVSSRISKKLENWRGWFLHIGHAVRKMAPHQAALVVPDTSTYAYVRRAATIHDQPLVSLVLPSSGQTIGEWLNTTLPLLRTPPARSQQPVYVSPRLDGIPGASNIPLRDLAVSATSTQLLALHLRSGGHTDQLVRQRLLGQRTPTTSLAVRPDLTPSKLCREMLELGAVGCALYPTSFPETAPTFDDVPPIACGPAGQTYLTHCTRRRSGPWPGQTQREFLDELLCQPSSCEQTPLAALERIVRQRRLLAFAKGNHCRHPVVSFTAAPLNQVRQMRKYRGHRGRWDFEPYGISIEKRWLENQGTRAVAYFQPNERKVATTDFRQPCFSTTKAGHRIDWTSEQEWRHRGDLDLSRLPAESAIVFVEKVQQLERLTAISPWPVTTFEALANANR